MFFCAFSGEFPPKSEAIFEKSKLGFALSEFLIVGEDVEETAPLSPLCVSGMPFSFVKSSLCGGFVLSLTFVYFYKIPLNFPIASGFDKNEKSAPEISCE